jgi:predicted nucleotidyltransferase
VLSLSNRFVAWWRPLQCIADELKKRRALEGQNERYMKARKKTVSDEILQEIVRRIVRVAKPEKIILFGSAAREEMGPDSDLDFLVIKSCKNRRKTARKIRRRLLGIGIPKDIIVATPEDIERYKDTIGLIYRPALKQGKLLYAA